MHKTTNESARGAGRIDVDEVEAMISIALLKRIELQAGRTAEALERVSRLMDECSRLPGMKVPRKWAKRRTSA